MGRLLRFGLLGIFATLIVGAVISWYNIPSYLAYFPVGVIVLSFFLLVANTAWIMGVS